MRKARSARSTRANVTIKDIANHLGIAYSTVSRALNDHPYTNRETKERVRRAAEKLGYVPHVAARALRSDKGVLVGLILPNIVSEAFATAAQILSHRCLKEGLQMVLAISEDDADLEYAHVVALNAARAAGIVIAPSHTPHDKTVSLLQSVPTVQYARHHPRLAAPGVSVNSEHGVALATRHLLQLGHRRIAYLGPNRRMSTGAERFAGFLGAQKRSGPKDDPSMTLFGPMSTTAVKTALLELLQRRTRPTGVIVAAGAMMPGALAALRDLRLKVPRDISIVGYGNPAWYEAWGPGITAIGQPFALMADAAASRLMEQIAGSFVSRDEATQLELDPEFIVRGSTAPLPTGTRHRSGSIKAGR